MIVETPESVLSFWFGDGDDDARIAKTQSALWWGKNPETDRMLAQRFGNMLEAVRSGALASWMEKPRDALALTLLTDQMPRSIYRGTPLAFASDTVALAVARQGIEAGQDRQLRPLERVFFYLPFEHAESMAEQDRSVALFSALFQQAPPDRMELYRGYLTFALRHRHVIARFGRFPHRNAVLGRESTEEERVFLSEPGSSF
jgi:uncharacterized protein (DUF924 family)